MEKANIYAGQLFVLMFIFELGSALLIPLGIEAKQDVWLAIFFGMLGGLLLFFVHLRLHLYYPDKTPPEFVKELLGKFFGTVVACIYTVYFLYIAARVLRDFGEMLVTFAYNETPLFIVNALFLLTVVYGVYKGIEVIARTGELLFVILYALAIAGFVLVVVSGLIDFSYLQPVLEDGFKPVLQTVFTETWYVPFGEIIVFTMIYPYVKNKKAMKKAGIIAILLSGVNLIVTMSINIAVLGVELTARTQFPLLNTIHSIQIAEFLERLDVFFMIALIIGGFIKISLFFYAGVISVSVICNVKNKSKLVYPIGIVVLFISLTQASSYAEHMYEGITIVPLYMHLPLQVIVPVFLLIVAFIKNRHKKEQSL
ncbi:spore germination protein KB [Alteribacillus persepolensis]|uniref:Spore germination protein KB n=1 Tax=Alteribacillus persepolensis TaxID=568899 RepID=A0A1G7Z2G6_9BACI|nr:GerAB/ArcD/ProY family transporter [Alteribacillus persepolensis]SDH02769.1 spore germination protein KB [Alteribacillus persepolensis]